MRIGIDIGGSHIGIGLVDNNGKIILKQEYEITKNEKKNIEKVIEKHIIETIDQIQQIQNLKNIELIGICSCGMIKQGEIVKATNLNIYNFKIVELLKKYFNLPIILRNDAKCAGIAEKKYGSLKEYDDAVFLTIGTGIGGACFINGKFLEPKRFAGFEMGHVVIESNGRKCSCGSKGCWETYCSIKALKNDVQKKLKIKRELIGTEFIEVLKNENNKEIITPIIDEYAKYLALGISNLINIFEPEIISLGGSFPYYEKFILEKVKNNIYVFNEENIPNIVMATLGNDAGIVGAVNI